MSHRFRGCGTWPLATGLHLLAFEASCAFRCLSFYFIVLLAFDRQHPLLGSQLCRTYHLGQPLNDSLIQDPQTLRNIHLLRPRRTSGYSMLIASGDSTF